MMQTDLRFAILSFFAGVLPKTADIARKSAAAAHCSIEGRDGGAGGSCPESITPSH